MKPKKRTEPSCKVEGCVSLWYGGRGYCAKHYIRLRKHGDPLLERKPGWLPGDPNNPSHKPERKAQISAWRKGVPLSAETKKRQSATLRRVLASAEMRAKWRSASLKKPPLSAEARKKISVAHAKRPKKMSSILHNLDAAFSRYIRYKYSDHTGRVPCFTCEQANPIKEMDCGHFVSRQHKATRWMEENAHPQCRYCNRYNEGRKDVYAVRLVEKYGADILRKLQVEKMKILHVNQAWAQEQVDDWKRKLAALMAERECVAAAYKQSFYELEPA